MSSGLSTSKSLGLHGHWGLSASFDFCEAFLKLCDDYTPTSEPIRFLLVNPADIRHILSTVSKRRRHFQSKMPEIHFYVLENPVEIVARELLLLELLLDFEVPIRQRATIFLEVYGNLKIQKRTSNYMEYLAKRLHRDVTVGRGYLQNMLQFDCLNHRDRDQLENAIKFYDKPSVFGMDSLFDHRKRGLYEDRYDARKAINDWDYHSGLKKKASIIHIKQYKHWRETGVAFEFGDQVYTEPNKSFMTYTEGFMRKGKDKGIKKEVH
jgi:dynein assembly factor 3